MQISLRLINIRLDVAIDDITGQSDMAVIEAILSGVRDPERLALLVSTRVKKSRQEITDALHGWWRDELLFELQACLDFYKPYDHKIKECDQVIEERLITFAPKKDVTKIEQKQLKAHKKKRDKHASSLLRHAANSIGNQRTTNLHRSSNGSLSERAV